MKKIDMSLGEFKQALRKEENGYLYPSGLRKVTGYLIEIPHYPTNDFHESYVVHIKDGIFLIPYDEFDGDRMLVIGALSPIDSKGLEIVEQQIKDLQKEIADLTYILDHHKLKRLFMK